ncbi:hypothetical protein NRB56_20310 [Nocardia sp. RB56]|uniref:DUF4351 domain-containing protein n=2 Tax=Nocardia aurantia TaxID=2585199 RepID=A0A7K0DL03_9NOCA|nr:hypothetical protein [Nocardia aurantia]
MSLNAFDPRVREVFVTTAERLRVEGRLEGRLEAQREVVLMMLELKFGPLAPVQSEAVRFATGEELDFWLHRILDARQIDDVLVA